MTALRRISTDMEIIETVPVRARTPPARPLIEVTVLDHEPEPLAVPAGVDPIGLLSSIDDGRGPSVAVVVSDGTSVLMICHELGIPSRSQWAVPSGQRGSSETPEACATRRVREDSGVRTDRGELVPLGIVKNEKGTATNLFFVRLGEPQILQPGLLVAAVEWFPGVMAVESAADGDITDALTCLALLRASSKGLL